MIRSLFLLATLFLLHGCVRGPMWDPYFVSPVPETEPFSDELLTEVKVGETTREQIVTKLGEPDQIWDSGSVYLYSEWQNTGGWDITTERGWIPHFLFVEFDKNDRVAQIAKEKSAAVGHTERENKSVEGALPRYNAVCTPWGLCGIMAITLRAGGHIPVAKQATANAFLGELRTRPVLYYDPYPNDPLSRAVGSNQCDVFVYFDVDPGIANTPRLSSASPSILVKIDGTYVGPIPGNSYTRYSLPQGQHKIGLYSYHVTHYDREGTPASAGLVLDHEALVDCEPGRQIFMAFDWAVVDPGRKSEKAGMDEAVEVTPAVVAASLSPVSPEQAKPILKNLWYVLNKI